MDFIISLSILCFVSLAVGIPSTGNGRMKDFPGFNETNEANRLADEEDLAVGIGDSVHFGESIVRGSDWVSLSVCGPPYPAAPPSIDVRRRPFIYMRGRSETQSACAWMFDVNVTGSQRMKLEHVTSWDQTKPTCAFSIYTKRNQPSTTDFASCGSFKYNPRFINGPFERVHVSFQGLPDRAGLNLLKLGRNGVIVRATVESKDDGKN